MKAVKTMFCCIAAALIIVAVLFSPNAVKSHAAVAPRYARADARDIYFCERKDLNYALFTIPYTYCVEILSTDGDWYYVRYAEDSSAYRALYGYCLSSSLTPVEEPPPQIYLNMPIVIKFKPDAPENSLPVLGELNVTAAFYGTYYAGATAYSYVYYDGTFGYVYGAHDDYPLNEIPSDEPPAEKPDTSGGGANTKLITGIALAGVAAAALIILYFSGRRKYFRPDR